MKKSSFNLRSILDNGIEIRTRTSSIHSRKENVELLLPSDSIHEEPRSQSFWNEKHSENLCVCEPEIDRITDTDRRIGRTLKKLRKEQGTKQDTIARSIGMGQSTYSKIEQGLKALTVGQLEIVARFFNKTIRDFF